MKNKLEKFLVDMTYGSTYVFLEQGSSDELDAIAKKRGIELPTTDLAFFKTTYALVNEENLNFCTLPEEEVSKSLGSLVGKSIDIDHFRKKIVGAWIDCELVDNKIIAWGTFYKSSLAEDYEIIKELMEEGKLFVSFEAWGKREYIDDKSYNLTDIVFAGGALLVDTNPAFPEAEVLELSKKKRILEMASTMTRPKEFVHTKEEINQDPKSKEKGGLKNDMLKTLFEKVKKEEDVSFDIALKFYKATDEEKVDIPEEAQEWAKKVIADLEVQMQKASKKPEKIKEKSSYDMWDIDTISRIMWEVECPTCKTKGNQKITMLDFINSKAQTECYEDETVIEVDLIPSTKVIKKGKTQATKKQEEPIVKDLLKKHEQKEDMEAIDLAKFIDTELDKVKAEKVEVDTKVADIEVKLTEANTKLAAIEEAAEKAGVKVEELAKDIDSKIVKAREDAKKLTERKIELTEEFAKDMSDEDLLNDDKYNSAKKDKELAKVKADLDKAGTDLEEAKKLIPEGEKILVAGSKDKIVVDDVNEATKRVAAMAYPEEEKV